VHTARVTICCFSSLLPVTPIKRTSSNRCYMCHCIETLHRFVSWHRWPQGCSNVRRSVTDRVQQSNRKEELTEYFRCTFTQLDTPNPQHKSPSDYCTSRVKAWWCVQFMKPVKYRICREQYIGVTEWCLPQLQWGSSTTMRVRRLVFKGTICRVPKRGYGSQ
jgi:hypothetical protein